MRSALALGAGMVAMAALACAPPRPVAEPSGPWALIRPPEVADAQAPRGLRLVPGAPLAQWPRQATFDTEAHCEAKRQQNADTAIDRALATQGDDAKFDPEVRRSVNARCVRNER
jgi:hypothetical protein